VAEPSEEGATPVREAPDPKVRLYRVLAYTHEKGGQPLHAIEALEKAKALAPHDTNVRFDLGVLYDKQGRAAEAEAEMTAVIERDPRHARALNYLGYTWAERGLNLDEAEALIRRALEVDPDDGYYVDSLGWVQFRRGHYDEAVATLEHAVELVPEDPVITEHLGDAYAKAGKKQRAIETYRRSLELDASKAEVRKKLEELTGHPEPAAGTAP
jgi:Flp pilus assembly protein TadD